ncbi:T9SS type B sorting domain-containing protein [Bizionia argentinensis JUB59]|uniref:T9SS type B sorting domain-containing protein n=1 Tax=Bizionia argentinensis JUB59 TaxID=1046627 RepID=G2EF41_9FLAO|nr:choice-of-anchor L domain-containing protein [Bizionia argentinensis]EGV42929.2 T9SS type B sorting domain-containing protein [Bizionia argentinensis JUB59]
MKYLFFVCLLATFINNGFAQNISINDTFTAKELIEDRLIEGCVEISNVQSIINGTINNINSFGYFDRGDSSFPFANGILLSTGAAVSAGNSINTTPLNDGDVDWLTDPDLETALGLTNTLNATSIEFDFKSISNQVQFNYILASEEYFDNYPCQYSDGFAFLIKEAGTSDPYINVALIPGTIIPVNTSTIHEEIVGFCPAENEQYFDGYNLGDTNFNGRTIVLTASAIIQPNVKYHIKLVIADQRDENFDSAVFIEGNSFNSSVDLGPDITTCANSVTLDGNIQNSLATYTWLENGTPLIGENSSTLIVNSSGIYTVTISIPINNTICEIEDTISITLNSERAVEYIPDFIVCDDVSNNGVETFDLSIKDSEVLAAVPSGNYTISYHYNTNNAHVGSFPITTPTKNTTNPQIIHVRILDVDNGCLTFGTLNLIVNPLPTITPPSLLEVCDDSNGDGFTLIDLTVKNTEITGDNPNFETTYHYNQTDAESGENAVPNPYSNITQNDLLFVSVVDSRTGCRNTTTLGVRVLDSPDIDSQTHTIDACAQDDGGFEIFDLTSIIDDVLDGLINVSTSFHETNEDAQTDANPISNITNYTNTVRDFQIIFIRVEDNTTGCASIASIELHANLLINKSNIRNFSLCDDASNDGIAIFNLENIANTITSGLIATTITFYKNATDQAAGTNPIATSTPYEVTQTPQKLFITLKNSYCSVGSEIDLIILPALNLPTLGSVTLCSSDDDTFTSVDLYSFNNYVLTGVPRGRINYFLSEENAMNNTNRLPRFYNNVSNPFVLYVRVQNASGCYDVQPLEVEVLPAPLSTKPSDEIICDDDQDGFSIINLEAKVSEIVSNTTNLSINFYRSLTEAENDYDRITNTTAYNADTQSIFTRIERISTGCFNIESFEIIVNTLPVFTTISDFNNCETDGDQIAEFIFEDKDADIINGQTGKRVIYFENATDALNNANSIDKTSVYENKSNPQLIHVRVENISDTSCFGLSTFFIEVGSVPIYNAPVNIFLCDDVSNDGQELFNLTAIQTQISAGSTDNLTITFYESFQDADNAENPIDLNYTNQTNPQQIFTRIENGTYCHGIAQFGLNVIKVPRVNQASKMINCDTDADGLSTFDLTVATLEVLDIRKDDILVTYHETVIDLADNINNIPNPQAYNNIINPQMVYIRVTNTVSKCYVMVPLELEVNLPPPLNLISNFPICNTVDNSFDLQETTEALIGNQENIELTFYISQTQAETAQNALNPNYNYSSYSDILYVRAENTLTSCFTISNFTLVVNPSPIAISPPNLETCDDDFDSMLIFDLSEQTLTILGGQNPADFVVSYFELEIEALENVNPISDLNYNAFHEQVIYVRVQNKATNCFNTTSFIIFVSRKPFVEISDQPVCIDNLPLVVSAATGFDTDTYLWSTNATSSEIEITEIGSYSITVKSQFGCITSETFNVIESESATIEFTETVDFSNPNNITVTISGIGDYVYILDDGEPQTSNVFYNVTIGPHTIEVYDLNGCASTMKDIVIIDAPLFFTPNNDGQNDTWHITGVNQIPGTIVYIFDRYGKLLKTLNHTSIGWDGTYNGANMPTDDYWFVAKVKKGEISFEVKRHFTLKR